MAAPPYFPEQHGADCPNCWMKDHRDGLPVGPEINPGSGFIVIGEAPGGTEIEEGRPFVGKSGFELSTGLGVHGVRRQHASFTNSICCKAPDDALDLQLHKLQRENKRREKENTRRRAEHGPDAQLLSILASPFDCCRPRLLKDLAGFQNVIAVGKRAAEAALGHPVSIMESRGGPVDLPGGVKVMPTLHPAFILRMRRWTRAFRADLGRALRWFRGDADWRPPRVTFNPTPEALSAFLTKLKSGAYDTETKSPLPGRPELAKDPLLARLGLLGVGNDDEVMVVAFLGVDGSSTFYPSWQIEQLQRIFVTFFTDPAILKIDFNGYYDVPIIRRHFGVTPWPRWDCILAHRDVEPELPHGLGYVASVHTHIPYAWKVDHSGTDAETDAEWREYNSIDVTLSHRIAQPLNEAIQLRSQQTALAIHHAVQRLCIGMHEHGVWVNQAKRAEWGVKLRAEAIEHLTVLKQELSSLGMANDYARDFNPGSIEQLKDLFFTRWGFTPVDFSKKTGEPSTGDETLREWLRDPKLKMAERNFITRLRRFRATTKRRGIVRRLVSFREVVPKDPLSVEEDEADRPEYEEDVTERKARRPRRSAKGPKQTWGLVHDDQRVHSHFNAHSITCVAPETLVLTAAGPQRIITVGAFSAAAKTTAPAPAALKLHDGSELRKVTSLVNAGTAPRLEVMTALGLRLIGAAWHRVQIAERNKFLSQKWSSIRGGLPRVANYVQVEPAWKWATLDELKIKKTYVRVPIGMNAWGDDLTPISSFNYKPATHNANAITLPTTIDESLAFFAGVYTADGSLHDADGSFTIRISNGNLRKRKEVIAVARRLFGHKAVCEYPNGKRVGHVSVKSVALREWTSAVGFKRGINRKAAPSWVLRAPWRIIAAYIRGCAFDSHFTVVDRTTLEWIYTGTKGLAEEMQTLLLNRGIPASLADKRYGRSNRSWSCIVYGDEARKVAAITKQVPPHTDRTKSRPKFIRRGNTLWLRVVDVQKLGRGPLLDVTVPSTHAFWSNGFVSHNTGWRTSSNDPNCQNVERRLRPIFAPHGCPLDFVLEHSKAGHWRYADGTPFRVYLYADQDQGEMRIIAALAGAPRLLQAFKDKKDPHALNATDFFGDVFTNASKVPRAGETVADWDRLRDGSKTLFYAMAYEASFDTIYETVTSAEDANGNLPFVSWSQSKVRAAVNRFMERNQEIVAWWEKEIEQYRRQGFLTDPLFGYRCDFLDGEERNKLVNFRSQSLLGAIQKRAGVQVADGASTPLHSGVYGHGTGLILDGHDRLDFELPVFHERRYVMKGKDGKEKWQYGWCEPGCTCPLEKARVALTEAMHQTVPGLDVQFQGQGTVVLGGWV